ncbi:hypothetical protein RchiOBHm_Chr7g0197711 [Rosa chinensis]|uniref:Uncharacterized protein n=1 Tax=Rosa chinensis TaxID=74649 RepID=A0A2P6P6Y9_ROSCH|nr:uncharacterized protein LOC112178188 [Rosa chinensis]XP_024172142.1 uncharacterized protein LOC112178188 [Rosa chinensis]PRQ17686.1 hypothetical protein RchiOBHm_Chr7g0197711 [Rosa chinensis]
MGLEMEFEKNCRVGLSPNTVLPTHRHSCVEKRSTKGRPPRKDDLLSIKEGFVEISFQRYRSTSCKVPSRPVGQEVNIELKRGSIYQNSKEVREIKKMGTAEGRKKIEKSRCSDSSFSYRIVDSLRSSGDESPQNRSSVLSLKPELNVPSAGRPHVEPCSLDSILEICVDLDDREEHSAEALGEDPMRLNLRSDPVAGPLNNGNELLERDEVHKLPKSFSAKLEMLHTPSPSESDRSSSVSSKARFNNLRKMFDPFMKSKSLRSPSYVVEPGGAKTTGMVDMTKSRTYQKSLLPVFANKVQNAGCDSLCINQDNHQSSVASSPVHLHGHLKLQNKHGMPFFEFSLKGSEDVFVARTWKADNGFNWVYTFHAVGGRKKSNASGVGLHGSDRDSSMVGQMPVSCYLCSELRDGAFDNSMVTEFGLYDICHARQIAAEKAHSNCTLDDAKHPKGSNQSTEGATLKLGDGSCPTKVKSQHKSSDSDSPAWPFAALHPGLEIAAIVMQVPFEKRESLKYKRGDKVCDKVPANLLKLSMVEQKNKDDPDKRNSGNLKVIIPSGNHGFPVAESKGPSSLLDRWRLGGGCDCGGWDMSCPLTVLSNPNIQLANNQLFEETQQPLELFVQGSKEKKPALTMTMVEDGQYAVDFHAQLSTLQAFSMCVSILHGTETSTAVTGQEESKQLSQCNSLKVLKEEVKFLIEAVTEGEKKKVAKRVKKIQPSYVLDSPFSPIARV